MILFRYLTKEIYANLVAILIVLLIIFTTNQLVHYLNGAAAGKITMTAVLKVMSIQVPLLLGYLLPLGLYLAILLAFARLYLDHEMAVLRACGVSSAKLIGIIMILATSIAVFDAWLMLWAESRIENYRIQVMTQAIESASLEKVIPKRFQSLDGKGVFYADNVFRRERSMSNVFLAVKKKNAWDITVARAAELRYLPHSNTQYAIFEKGTRYIGMPGTNNFQVMHFNHYGIGILAKIPKTHDFPKNTETTTLWKLRHSNLKAAAALQWRIAMPISAIIFALLAFPLSKVNPRRGKFAQLLPAILIYSAYADLLFLGRTWIARGETNAALGLWWLHGSALLLALLLLAHQAGWKRSFRLLTSKWGKHAAT